MAVATRFSEVAAQYFDVIFMELDTRLVVCLTATFGVLAIVSAGVAQNPDGQVAYPRLPRALLGIDPQARSFDREALSNARRDGRATDGYRRTGP